MKVLLKCKESKRRGGRKVAEKHSSRLQVYIFALAQTNIGVLHSHSALSMLSIST